MLRRPIDHCRLCGRFLARRSLVPPPPALRRGSASASAAVLLLVRPVVVQVVLFASPSCVFCPPLTMGRDMVAAIVLSHAISSSVRSGSSCLSMAFDCVWSYWVQKPCTVDTQSAIVEPDIKPTAVRLPSVTTACPNAAGSDRPLTRSAKCGADPENGACRRHCARQLAPWGFCCRPSAAQLACPLPWCVASIHASDQAQRANPADEPSGYARKLEVNRSSLRRASSVSQDTRTGRASKG